MIRQVSGAGYRPNDRGEAIHEEVPRPLVALGCRFDNIRITENLGVGLGLGWTCLRSPIFHPTPSRPFYADLILVLATAFPQVKSGASSELVFTAYWAPPAALAADAPLLSSIATCYGPERGSLFQVFQDQVFTYIMPPGWTVADESQNNIDLHLGTTADVSYVLLEAIPSSQVSSAQGLIDYVLGHDGFSAVDSLTTITAPSQATQAGTQSTEYEEFTGTLSGVSDHGLIYATTSVGGGVASGVVRIAVSSADEWNSLNSGMIQMAGAIQHNFSQDLQQLQQVMQQFQDFSGQVEDFDDVLNNQQLVQDPTSGKYYEAPYSSYTVDGPAGPGYYLPTGQRLNEIQRS